MFYLLPIESIDSWSRGAIGRGRKDGASVWRGSVSGKPRTKFRTYGQPGWEEANFKLSVFA